MRRKCHLVLRLRQLPSNGLVCLLLQPVVWHVAFLRVEICGDLRFSSVCGTTRESRVDSIVKVSMSGCESSGATAAAVGAGGGDGFQSWSTGEPLPTAAQLEHTAKRLVERVNAKRLRDEQRLRELRDGLQAIQESATRQLEAAWYRQMQADSEMVRRQVETLFQVIAEVGEHELEVQTARQELNKLIAEMADRQDTVAGAGRQPQD